MVYLIDLDAQLEKMNKEQKEMQTNLENWRVRDKDANNVTNPTVEGVYLMPIISTYISLSKMYEISSIFRQKRKSIRTKSLMTQKIWRK